MGGQRDPVARPEHRGDADHAEELGFERIERAADGAAEQCASDHERDEQTTDSTRSELISRSSGMPRYSTGTATNAPTSGSRAKANHSNSDTSSEKTFQPAFRVSMWITDG